MLLEKVMVFSLHFINIKMLGIRSLNSFWKQIYPSSKFCCFILLIQNWPQLQILRFITEFTVRSSLADRFLNSFLSLHQIYITGRFIGMIRPYMLGKSNICQDYFYIKFLNIIYWIQISFESNFFSINSVELLNFYDITIGLSSQIF